jgi:threonylcarbamoyladenosine tRNA methylthiotransferase CDKAL1
MKPRVYIESYGCSNSRAEGEMIAGILEREGFYISNGPEDSDLLIFVTCDVKSPTERKVLSRIRKFRGRKIIISGCMPDLMREKLLEVDKDASLLSTHHIKEVAQVAKDALDGKRVEILGKVDEIKLCLPRKRSNPVINIVPISSGCDSSCSYCCVRLTKGRLFSYPKTLVLREVESSLSEGCKEIFITAQDTASYGKGEGENLPTLLREISSISGKFQVRVGMMNPLHAKEILASLLDSYSSEKVFKFLHLPVQSGSDEILKSMRRGYGVGDFLEIIGKFRENFKEISVLTDIIVGYPGETEKDFDSTMRLVKQASPDAVFISKFGPRPMTEAAELEQLDKKVVDERSGRLHKLAKSIALERNMKWVGWEGEILVDERIRGGLLGRNFAYKPVVIRTNQNVFGQFVNVEVEDATAHCLFAKIKKI